MDYRRKVSETLSWADSFVLMCLVYYKWSYYGKIVKKSAKDKDQSFYDDGHAVVIWELSKNSIGVLELLDFAAFGDAFEWGAGFAFKGFEAEDVIEWLVGRDIFSSCEYKLVISKGDGMSLMFLMSVIDYFYFMFFEQSLHLFEFFKGLIFFDGFLFVHNEFCVDSSLIFIFRVPRWFLEATVFADFEGFLVAVDVEIAY